MRAIIAKNNNGTIGLNNKLPWSCKDDLKHFKELTLNCKLLVGYNTASELPPLKNREIVVDSRDLIDTSDIDWCIGGSKTYEKYCHLFTELHISQINDNTIGDTLCPLLLNLNPKCKIIYYHFNID